MQAQVREDPDNHRGFLDGGDDLECAPALRAVFQVDVEHAFEQLRPTHPRRVAVRVLVHRCAVLLRGLRDDRRTQFGVRGEHPVEAAARSAQIASK